MNTLVKELYNWLFCMIFNGLLSYINYIFIYRSEVIYVRTLRKVIIRYIMLRLSIIFRNFFKNNNLYPFNYNYDP